MFWPETEASDRRPSVFEPTFHQLDSNRLVGVDLMKANDEWRLQHRSLSNAF
jgi:hypothetical protein